MSVPCRLHWFQKRTHYLLTRLEVRFAENRTKQNTMQINVGFISALLLILLSHTALGEHYSNAAIGAQINLPPDFYGYKARIFDISHSDFDIEYIVEKGYKHTNPVFTARGVEDPNFDFPDNHGSIDLYGGSIVLRSKLLELTAYILRTYNINPSLSSTTI